MAEIFIPFAGGVDESTQEQLVDPKSAMVTVQNLTHTKRGSLSKAPGTVTAPYTLVDLDAAAITSGRTLDSLGDKLVASDASGVVRVWSPSFAAWAEVGQLPECTVTRRAVAGTQSDAPYTVATYEPTTDVMVVLWTQYIGTNPWIRYAAIERSTGVVLAEDWISEGEHARITTVGTYAVAVFEDSGGTLTPWYFDCTAPTGGWTDSGISWTGYNLDTPAGLLLYDLLPVSSTVFIAAYALTAGTNRIQLRRVETAGWTVTHSATVATASTDPVALSLGGTDLCWIAYAYGTAARVVALSLTDLTSVGTTATWITFSDTPTYFSVVTTGTQTATIVGTGSGASMSNYGTARGNLSISAGAVAFANVSRMSSITHQGAAHAMLVSDALYFPAWTPQFDSINLLRFNQAAVTYAPGIAVATFGQRLAGTGAVDAIAGPMHSRPMSFGNSQYGYVFSFKRGPGSYSAELVTFDFTPERPSRVQYAEALQFAGGALTQYDGRNIETVSHIERPMIMYVSDAAGNVAAGTYSYVAVYERQDATGQWHPGAPSDPYSYTAAGSEAIDFYLSNPSTTRTGVEQVRVGLYRTKLTGSTYYLVGYAPCTELDTYSLITDNLADSTLDDNATLYTQPGQLGTSRPRRAPPALRHLCVHQDRIAGVAEDGVSVWYSAPRVSGEGAWFDDAFQFQVEQGGDITALWSQDGRLIVAKRRALYVVDGDGPPENGGNGNEFSPPVRLPVHVGCVTSRAIATSDAGTFFVSERGIELLTRSMQVAWIGEAIEDTLAAYPDVASILVEPLTSLVRFILVDDIDTPTACRLAVYDTNNKTWEVRTLPAVAVDQCLHDGVWHFLAATGQVYQETAASYLDGSTWRTGTVETGWIKFSQMADWAQVKKVALLMEQGTHANVAVSLAYDDGTSYDQTRTWTAAEVNALSRKHLEFVPTRQKARTLKVRVTDATPSDPGTYPVTTGQGPVLYGLAIEFEPLGGATRRPDGAR